MEGVNIGQIIANNTDNLLKELAGSKGKYKPKVIDNVMVFLGAAGGVGTSTLVANLAYTLSTKGLTVLIIDLNIMYPVQHNFFRIKQRIDKADLVSFLLGRNSIGESIDNTAGNISLMVAHNRTLIDSINCDSEICSKNMEEGLDRLRELFDVILIDCPMDLQHDVVNTVLYKADSIYLVWDENIACIGNTERLRRNMTLSGIEAYNKVRAVMNKRTNIYYSTVPFKKLGIELLAVFPFEKAILECGLNGEIFCKSGASRAETASIFVKEMEKLADKVLEIGGYTEWTQKDS